VSPVRVNVFDHPVLTRVMTIRGVVGFFGFNSDRGVGLRALAVAATKDDIHSVFAGSNVCYMTTTTLLTPSFSRLALMSYHGSVLLLARDHQTLFLAYPDMLLQSGYQADEVHILKQYKAIVDK
jgi:hypothetical protein